MTVIKVPTINDSASDLVRLHTIWNQASVAKDEVKLDFSECGFLRQNAVAFLGGLIRHLQARRVPVKIRAKTLSTAVKKHLEKNGFAKAFGGGSSRWTDNVIPFREDPERDDRGYERYLADYWLGRGWVDVSPGLRDAIIERVAETYANAFDHAQSPVGVFTCGQYYPNLKQLRLSLVDFGVGIPSNVRLYGKLDPVPLRGADCMQWAFRRGTSTKRQGGHSRGLGLDLLKNFIQVNQGSMDVFSHDGRASVVDRGVSYASLSRSFEGTLVNICIQCDDRYYSLASENVSDVDF